MTPRLLETTLRDGSYSINFQFTAADTATLCRELERTGFDLIEIGHGIGLGASEAGLGAAAETDEGYCKAAASVLTRARWGMFCIPGVARLEHIDQAADLGMGFVRIGSNVTEVAASRPFIERARARGLFVCSNFMKSYAADPVAFGALARQSEDYGSETIYIVDSAGGMLADDLTRYVEATRAACTLPVAFHGHDNLGLAVSNTLHMVGLGAAIVDTSLQGMGRSSGNAATELVVAALLRSGYALDHDLIEIMDIGERYVRPLLSCVGLNSLDVVSGFAQFHSSYMGVIRKASTKYQVDPRRLIMAVCAEDKVDAPEELVDRIALGLSAEAKAEVVQARYDFSRYVGAEQLRPPPPDAGR